MLQVPTSKSRSPTLGQEQERWCYCDGIASGLGGELIQKVVLRQVLEDGVEPLAGSR